MPRFKLVLQDASGKSRTATVEAASQAEAVDLARRKGYQVRQIEPVFDLDDAEPPAPMDTAEHGYDDPPRKSSRARAAGGKPSGVMTFLPMLLAGLALVVALFTLVYVIVSDPLGSGLGKYDFSSPRAAYKSHLEMEKNADVRAEIQYARKFRDKSPLGKSVQERLDSYQVRKEVEFGNKQGLFITVKVDNREIHSVRWYEKDEDSGYWIEAEVNQSALNKEKPELAEQISKFLATGEVSTK